MAQSQNDDQIQRQLDRLPQVPIASNPDAPKVIFPTACVLDGEQESAFMEFNREFLKRISREMGLDRYNGTPANSGRYFPLADNTDFTGDWGTFMEQREIFTALSEGDVSWRQKCTRGCLDQDTGLGTIWQYSNYHIPVSQRLVEQLKARAQSRFFGVEPYIGVYPIGKSDAAFAKQVEDYARWKMRQCRIPDKAKEGIDIALDIGESVIKTTYSNLSQIFKSYQMVLTDPANQQILDSTQNNITINDVWIGEDGSQMLGGDLQNFPGDAILQKDPSTRKPIVVIWQQKLVSNRKPVYSGPDLEPIFYRDFLCPLSAKSVHTAEWCCHLYDQPVMTLVQDIMSADLWSVSDEAGMTYIQNAINALRNTFGSQLLPASGRNQPRSQYGEQDNSASPQNPIVQIAECYCAYDVQGEGTREMMVKFERNTGMPIVYDFLGNVTPDERRPFRVLRGRPVPQRWYGFSQYKRFFGPQMSIDLFYNRRNVRSGTSGNLLIVDKSQFEETKDDHNIAINAGATLTPVNAGVDIEKAIKVINIRAEGDQQLTELLQLMMQIMQNMSGVATGNDGQAAGLDSTQLATGIRNLEMSGQELSGRIIDCLRKDVEDVINTANTLIFANMDKDEVYEYFEGNVRVFATMTPETAARMSLNAELLLTQSKSEQQLESSKQAFAILMQYYALPYPVQVVMQPLVVSILRFIQIENADTLVVPIDPNALPPQATPAALPAPTPMPPAPGPMSQQAPNAIPDTASAPPIAMSAPSGPSLPNPNF